MHAFTPQPPRSLLVWFSAAVWLAVLLSPTAYCVFLMIVDRLQVPAPPDGLVVLLFCLIPVVALLVCGRVVWRSKLTGRWRVGWLVLTVLAMVCQVGLLFLIIVSAITVAISPAQ